MSRHYNSRRMSDSRWDRRDTLHMDESLASKLRSCFSTYLMIGGKYLGRERMDWLIVDRIWASMVRPAVFGKAAWGWWESGVIMGVRGYSTSVKGRCLILCYERIVIGKSQILIAPAVLEYRWTLKNNINKRFYIPSRQIIANFSPYASYYAVCLLFPMFKVSK